MDDILISWLVYSDRGLGTKESTIVDCKVAVAYIFSQWEYRFNGKETGGSTLMSSLL